MSPATGIAASDAALTRIDGMVTAAELLDKLASHYGCSDEQMTARAWSGGLFVREVGINGGYTARQSRCDAVYAGFTSTSGRLLVGHEIKVSRADWLAELRQAGKADFWHDNCHQWWVVAPAGLVKVEELPAGWGLIVPSGSGMRRTVHAATRDVTPSWDATRSILSRVETLRAQAVQRAHQHEYQEYQARLAEMRTQYEQRAAPKSATDTQATEFARQLSAAFAKHGIYSARPSAEDVARAFADMAELHQRREQLARTVAEFGRRVEQAAQQAAATIARALQMTDETKDV